MLFHEHDGDVNLQQLSSIPQIEHLCVDACLATNLAFFDPGGFHCFKRLAGSIGFESSCSSTEVLVGFAGGSCVARSFALENFYTMIFPFVCVVFQKPCSIHALVVAMASSGILASSNSLVIVLMTACMIQMSPTGMQSRKQSGRWPGNEALGADIYSPPRSLYPS